MIFSGLTSYSIIHNCKLTRSSKMLSLSLFNHLLKIQSTFQKLINGIVFRRKTAHRLRTHEQIKRIIDLKSNLQIEGEDSLTVNTYETTKITWSLLSGFWLNPDSSLHSFLEPSSASLFEGIKIQDLLTCLFFFNFHFTIK